jgi:TonB family protein
MMLLTDLALRSSVILAIGLLANAALARRSAALRHFALAATIFAAAAVVPLSLWVPEWTVPIASQTPTDSPGPATGATAAVIAVEDTPVESTSPVDLASMVAAIWAAGSVVSGVFLFVGIWRLWRTARRAHVLIDARWTSIAREVAESHGLWRPIELLLTDESDLLATWGLLRPRVLLPPHAREWSEDRIRIVLCHELAHIRRHDWFVQITAEVVRITFWFNPLMWIACTRLRRDSEQACDDAVLGQHVPAREYAGLLLDLARRCRKPTSTWASAVPMARPSTLERRIAAMLNPAINRATLSRQSITMIVLLLLAITVPTAAFRAAQTSPASLTGSVYDPTGGVMPGVALTLENAQEEKQQATSRADGRFDFPQVAPGKYVLSASLPGFRTLRQEFELKTARDWDRAITLQVGELKETINVRERRITGPVGPSQPQAAKPIRVGGNIKVPTKTLDVRPIYPKTMREAGREGVVPIEAIIGPEGSVTSVRVVSADVHPDFAIAAADAVRQWKFTPTLLNGTPVEVVMTVKVEFHLEN